MAKLLQSINWQRGNLRKGDIYEFGNHLDLGCHWFDCGVAGIRYRRRRLRRARRYSDRYRRCLHRRFSFPRTRRRCSFRWVGGNYLCGLHRCDSFVTLAATHTSSAANVNGFEIATLRREAIRLPFFCSPRLKSPFMIVGLIEQKNFHSMALNSHYLR